MSLSQSLKRMPKSTLKYKKILLYTLGDPAGVGSEIIIKSLSQREVLDSAIHLIIADHRSILQAVSILKSKISLNPMTDFNSNLLEAGALNILDLSNAPDVELTRPDAASAKASLEYLDKAVDIIKKYGSDIASLITLPVSKEEISSLGVGFKGHTEYLKERFSVDSVLMVFLTPVFYLYLATRHIPLREVSAHIDYFELKDAIKKMDSFFSRIDKHKPKIAVLGLNPHGGENGIIGDEEVLIIKPLIEELKAEGLNIDGPYPGDGFFRNRERFNYNIVVSLYHDQTLPVIKAMFDNTVNFTLGLPFLRFSPDHGPAYDIAGEGIANPASLLKAIEYSLTLNVS
ncbi:MAG: 4-hydroxythreonine-4-phosphate dehydrogenase PdxA [Candidatus Kaelpia aquatica]|nr:4-hydroxythreonine-4-phosphate dehydrogenase PdxA [Candidatus Kaelpia aquatica]